MSDSNQDGAQSQQEDKTSGIGRLGAGMFLIAALLVAGVFAWRTLQDGGIGASDQPIAEIAEPGIAELLKAAEETPDEAEGWLAVGYAYFERLEYAKSAEYYAKATEVDPKSAIAWSALGEALAMQNERDPMPAKALEAFKTAIEIDPTDPRSRYFLAVSKDLSGDHQGAIDDWLALLEDTPPGAPWDEDVKRTIEQVGKINNIPTEDRVNKALAGRSPVTSGPDLTAGNAIPGPTQEQIAAASAISPSDQEDMAAGMVDSLEGKLKANPKNVDGWVMLMRSRMVQGMPDKASAALRDAIAANPAQADRLKTEADILGVQ